MNEDEIIRRRIELLRPRAKFVAVTHSADFIDPAANLGAGFHYVNLYDEKIDSNVINSPHGLIMIHNTYLSSFSYNLLLCWLLCADSANPAAVSLNQEQLLKHNFKKYFAEQLLSFHNNIFSRAVFLETLLYEQACMIPVFEAKSQDKTLSNNADLGAQLMSAALSFHELGHVYLGKDRQIWDEIPAQHNDLLRNLLERAANNYSDLFVEEVRCDVISVLSCFEQFKESMEPQFRIRAIAFAFAAFAVLYSLTKSAKATTNEHKTVEDNVDFNSIEKRHIDYQYTIGIDLDFVERAKLVIELCENIAKREGVVLFDEAGAFPLPARILDDLLQYVDRIMESEDENARKMSLLVSESLHGHPSGLAYLYLRSKTFAFGTQRNADGTLRS